MARKESDWIAANLAVRFEDSTDAVRIAGTVASMWEDIDGALCPIIGQRGVAGLFRRSVQLTGRVYPWLIESFETSNVINLPALQAALSQQNCSDSISAADLLLQTFYELLADLIGPSLTEHLLRAVSANFFIGLPTQDISA